MSNGPPAPPYQQNADNFPFFLEPFPKGCSIIYKKNYTLYIYKETDLT